MAEDLLRYLEGRPVTARPDTISYRLSKFVRRNRSATAILLAAILSTVVAVGLFSWQWRQTRRAESQARAHLDDLHKLALNLLFDYHDRVARLPGSTALRERIATDALNYLQKLDRDAQADKSLKEISLDISTAWLRLGDARAGRGAPIAAIPPRPCAAIRRPRNGPGRWRPRRIRIAGAGPWPRCCSGAASWRIACFTGPTLYDTCRNL